MSDVAEMVEWLRAQIEADRTAALAATPGPWTVDRDQPSDIGPLDDCGRPDCSRMMARALEVDDDDVAQPWRENAQHIARHDPQDVIADADAKLQLVHAHGRPHECIALTGSGERSVVDGQPWELWEPAHTDDHGPCLVLRCLAQGYRHRDGWKDEWTT